MVDCSLSEDEDNNTISSRQKYRPIIMNNLVLILIITITADFLVDKLTRKTEEPYANSYCDKKIPHYSLILVSLPLT